MRLFGWMIVVGFLSAPMVSRAQSDVFGTWKEPGGSVIRVEHCGEEICLRLMEISKTAPARVDHHNPDASLRARTLCGLQIGSGFKASDTQHADGGTLYDPKSGKTYHGTLWLEGGDLHLRGYVGFKALGRTEVWQRSPNVDQCKA